VAREGGRARGIRVLRSISEVRTKQGIFCGKKQTPGVVTVDEGCGNRGIQGAPSLPYKF